MNKLKLAYQRTSHSVTRFAESKPLLVFIVVLALFVGLIVLGNMTRKPKVQPPVIVTPKTVMTYKIGTVPKVAFQAQIEKIGVVQITAQTNGIVSKINVADGATVARGKSLIALSSSYNGGNLMTVSRQLAQKQNELTEANYPMQKDLIGKQRALANESQTNFEQLREITKQSIGDTQNLINLNNDIIGTLDTNIQNLSAEPGATSSSLILSSKQLKSQFQSANNQLNSALRASNYQTDTDKSPTKLAELQKALTLEQLDIQEKSLDLGKDISALQVKLAQVNESMMYPSAPFAGTVERVLVRKGQSVTPGTPLVILSGSKNLRLDAVVYVSKDLADSISRIEPATFQIGDKTVTALPAYVSAEATSGNLYSAIYHLPEAEYPEVTDKSYVVAELPVGYPNTSSVIPFLPLDTVYQTQEQAYIFVCENNHAVSKKIDLGNVLGAFVEVKAGLKAGDVVIQDRSVIDGQAVVCQ